MQSSRRNTLVIAGAAAAALVGVGGWYGLGRSAPLASPATKPAPDAAASGATLAAGDPRIGERALGDAHAPVTVNEYFSLTCPHCAAFARDTLPAIKSKLIDTGKVRYVFHDFPLDQVALTAAMVARTLPAERYEPFCSALLASQDRWAFARGVNSTEELGKMAALAGMSHATFEEAISNTALRTSLLQMQDRAVKEAKVDATPYFVFVGPGGKSDSESGEESYDDFARYVSKVGGTT